MNLIFDFDGTICDSIKAVVVEVNQILSEFGSRETSAEELKRKGVKGLLKSRRISPLQLPRLVSEYRKRSELIYETALPIEGINNVLKNLSRKHKLGILTTNQKRVVKTFLDKHKLNYFNFINSEKNIFGKDKSLRKIISKHRLDPNETYYIGDETRDIEAAKKQQVKTLAVTWGAESKELLKKASPNMIISEPKELLKL